MEGFAPQAPLIVIATYLMRSMHFTSVKVTWRQLDELSFPLAGITHSSQIDVCKRVNLLKMNLLSIYKLLGRSIFREGALCHGSPLLTLPFSKKNKINGAK